MRLGPRHGGYGDLGMRTPNLRRLVAVAAVGVTLLLSACAGEERAADDPAGQDQDAAGRYEDDAAGFSIEYPEAWTAQEVTDQPAVRVALFNRQSAADDFAENVNVLLEELPAGVILDQYTEANVQNLQATFTNLEVLDEREDPIGDVPAHWIRYDADEQGRRLSFLQAWLVDGQRGFVLSYTGEGEEFETYLADAEGIFRSFRLT